MKKKLSLVILIIFVLGICTGLASAKGKPEDKEQGNKNKAEVKNNIKPYIDMENEWSREAVMEATILGFISGDDLLQFRPNQPLTKLEAIAMLLNAEGFQDEVDDYVLTEDEKDSFKKIPEWGQGYVAVALQEELILPGELQTFNPQQGIKRYELCIYLSRINGDTEIVPQSKKEFKDWADIPEEYREIVRTVHGRGLMNGDEQGNFSPNQIVKRCEMAVILGNLEDNVLHRFESSTIRGVIKAVSKPDHDGDYVIKVDTGAASLVKVDADDNTVIFFRGKEIEPEDIVIGSWAKIILKDDKAVLVRLSPNSDS